MLSDFENNEQVIDYKCRSGHFPNLSSNKDLVNLFIIVGLDKQIKEKFGKMTTDKNAIEFITTLYEAGQIPESISDFVRILVEYRECTKMISTYIEPFLSESDKSLLFGDYLHTEFNALGTRTGRFSSKNPNLLNLPIRKDRTYRGFIKPDEGMSVISIDMGQIEARILGIVLKVVTGDDTFINYLWEGKDIHEDFTKLFIDMYPEAYYKPLLMQYNNDTDKAFKAYRKIIKNTLTFPFVYLAGITKLAMINHVTEEQMKEVINVVKRKFPSIAEWHKYLFKQVREKGYLEALTGARIHAPLKYNQIANLTIQHTAAQVLLDVLYRVIFNAGLDCRLQVYDEIVMFVDNNKITETVEIFKEEALYIEKYPPNWHWWLKLAPLTFTVTVGKNYAELETVGEFSTVEGNWIV